MEKQNQIIKYDNFQVSDGLLFSLEFQMWMNVQILTYVSMGVAST